MGHPTRVYYGEQIRHIPHPTHPAPGTPHPTRTTSTPRVGAHLRTCFVRSDTFLFESAPPWPPPGSNDTLLSPPPPRLLVCVLFSEPSPSRSRSLPLPLVGEGYSFHPRASFIEPAGGVSGTATEPSTREGDIGTG